MLHLQPWGQHMLKAGEHTLVKPHAIIWQVLLECLDNGLQAILEINQVIFKQ